MRAGRYTMDGRWYDVRIRLKENQRDATEDIRYLYVRNMFGEMIPIHRFTIF